MNRNEFEALLPCWRSRSEAIRHAPATDEEIALFESQHGSIPSEFKTFLVVLGGGVVGSEWIDGIEQLAETHRKFKEERASNGWSLIETFVIGWDGAGNPMGIDARSGAVVVEDHNYGGIHVLAPSFESFLRSGLA